MSDEDKQTHYDLLHRIEHNDRRFRMAQSIFMTLIGLVLVGLIAAQFVVIRNFQDQSAERAQGLKSLQESNQALLKENKQLSEQTNHYIQCIAQFFATTDRQSRVLADLDKCTYLDDGKAVPGLILTPTAGSSTPKQTQSVTITPNMPGLEPVKPTEPSQPAQPAPVKVLGVQVCIPFTHVCVRQ